MSARRTRTLAILGSLIARRARALMERGARARVRVDRLIARWARSLIVRWARAQRAKNSPPYPPP